MPSARIQSYGAFGITRRLPNALTIHHKFAELFKLLFVDGNPAGVKAMLNAMGMIENKLRLPLVPTRITTFEAMRTILNELNIKC